MLWLVVIGGILLVSCQTPQPTRTTRMPLPPDGDEETAVPPTPELTINVQAMPAEATAGILQGVGLIGASTLDEYRGSENRGGEYAAVTFNMVEQLVRLRGFNLGEWGDWPEPRRTGYAYNWARSGATSSTMIEQEQHTGVAEQVARGEVTFVFILIGANDFAPYRGNTYANIYEGRMSDERLQQKVDAAVANVTLAVDTVLAAGAQGVGLSLFPSWSLEPGMQERFPDAGRQQRVDDAIDQINAGLTAMAEARGLLVVDPNAFGRSLLAAVDERGFLDIGGERIDFLNQGNEPHYARLADRAGHAGTVLSGMMANYYFIEPLNAAYQTDISPLTAEEILALAGLGDK